MAELANPQSHTLLPSFLRSLKAERRRPKTIEHYTSSASLFLAFCAEDGIDPLKARRADIQTWIVQLEEAGRAPATINNRFRGLRAFYDWLLAEGEIPVSPFGAPRARTLEAPQLEPTEKDVVAREDMGKVLLWLEKQRRWRDCALVAGLYDTGARREELATLTADRLDMETGYVTLEASQTKGKRGRVVRFSPRVLRYIDRYWRKPRKDERYVFNGPRGRLTGNGIYQIVRAVFRDAGISATIGPHDLRHTSASHIAEDGDISESDVMALYGWKSPTMFRHYSEQARQKAALSAHERHSPLERLR